MSSQELRDRRLELLTRDFAKANHFSPTEAQKWAEYSERICHLNDRPAQAVVRMHADRLGRVSVY